MNTRHIVWVQFSHISKWSWVVSALILVGILYLNVWGSETIAGTFRDKKEMFGAVLALMPFLAAVCVSESIRPSIYGMKELEMSARFSLKSIILVRMGIVGLENLLLALVAALFVGGSFFQTILYLLVPYLFTTYGSFLLVRKDYGGGGMYFCLGLAVAVSGLMMVSTLNFRWIYQGQYVPTWLAVMAVLAWLTFHESRKTLILAENYA